ncbi:MAG: transglutaminase-like domain-containing protein [Lachnospiraceae bacterium]|nr:transglutaminase-like domain-containing protein [Lachnospiraceae bacterium]
MRKRLSRFEKKKISELEQTGIAIDDVYGTKKSSPLFLCLSKALIIFMVCAGTVTGFSDALSLNYNKSAIVFFTLLISVLISLLYVNKKVFYIGYIAYLIIFTVELLRYYLYANSGFQAIMNRVREVYAEFFNMSVVRSAEESYTNRYVTITVTLIFIISFLVVMYNITVSRYMNFAETFAISFIILEIPFYIGYKPPLISVVLIMAGCICTGLLQKGAFNRVTIPGKNAPDYIRDKIFKKTYYTTRGSHRGILMVLAASLVMSFFLCIFSLPIFERDLGETPDDSAKAAMDDTIKIVVQNGIYGLFNRYDSINGLNRGVLGGVSSVSPDFKTDLVVSFVPYSKETVYLPGFKGITYTGMNWYNRVNVSDFPELKLGEEGYIDSSSIDNLDYILITNKLKTEYSPSEDKSIKARAQISYVDKSFGMYVYPYITLNGAPYGVEEPLYQPADPEKERVMETKETDYYPLEFVEYRTAEDEGYGDYPRSREYKIDSDGNITRSVVTDIDYPGTGTVTIRNGYSTEVQAKSISCYSYVNDICLKVPDGLNRYLDGFCKEKGYFGLGSIQEYKRLQSIVDEDRTSSPKIDLPISEELKERLMELGSITVINLLPDGGSGEGELGKYLEEYEELIRQRYEHKEALNDYRLKICEAIKNMFLDEYPYTLSPGKTPSGEDFVQYFLEDQKRGFCSHFASAAVMILRHLGIPARYVEGYCIPYSLMTEEANKLDIDGEEWFSGENEFNPDKNVYSVKVSDYYAHAWVEVYLEGQGFVPFEFTPPSYEAVGGEEMTGLGKFFSRLLNVDLGLGGNSEDTLSITGDVETPVVEEHSDMNFKILLLPLLILTGIVVLFWVLLLLIRRLILEIRYSRYLKEGRFAPLVFARYNELVKKLKKKKIVTVENPLPMEVCEDISVYYSDNPDVSEDKKDKDFRPIFTYIEKVLYSDYISNADEYIGFYRQLQEII